MGYTPYLKVYTYAKNLFHAYSNTMGKVLQQRCDNRRTGTVERIYKEREEDCSPYEKILGNTRKASQKRDLQEEIFPQWQSALKWGLREVQLYPFRSHS